MFKFTLLAAVVALCLFPFGCIEDPIGDEHLPSIEITRPDPTQAMVTVRTIFSVDWIAENTKKVRWILLSLDDFGGDADAAIEYINSHPDAPEWSDWQRYKPNHGEGTSFESQPQDFGFYVFAVQARNMRGDLTDVVRGQNAMHLRVSNIDAFPLLFVYNRYIGTLVSANLNTPPTVVDFPGGVEVSFELWASAEAYSGIVTGYRYGWDIADPDDPQQWEIDWTPFVSEKARTQPRSFFFGTHSIHIEVMDNSGFRSRMVVVVNIVPRTMERPLLVVDDWDEGPGAGFQQTAGMLPSDDENDAFWLEMVGDVLDFDPNADVMALSFGQIPLLPELMRYRNIIWNASGADGSQSVLGELIRWKDPDRPVPFGDVTPNLIAMYMAAGGHVMLCGERVMELTLDPVIFGLAYPVITRYELGGDQGGAYEHAQPVGEHSLAYQNACLDVLDVAYTTPNKVRRPGEQACPVNLFRDHNARTDGLRACNSLLGALFPRLELRPEVAATGKVYHESRAGLNCDIYNPQYFVINTMCGRYFDYMRDCFEPIYSHECVNTCSSIFGAPVAYWTSVYADPFCQTGSVLARSAIWGFHPVYFNPSQVKGAMDIILFQEWMLARSTPLVKKERTQ